MMHNFDLSTIKLNSSLPHAVLGDLSQIGIVTHDLERCVEGMLRLGLGPWKTYTFDRNTCTDLAYMGRPADFAFKVALCNMPNLMWELIQPLDGPNIYSDFLKEKGEGLHHLLFKCNGLNWEQKTAAFEGAGYSCIHSGKWLGRMSFAYYNTDVSTGILIEITDIPSDWVRPEAEETYG